VSGAAGKIRSILGMNRTVLALSFARLGDGIGNSVLFVVLPLYVISLPHPLLNVPVPLLVGVLISAFGLANAAVQPFAAHLTDRIGRYKLIIQVGLGVLAAATLAFVFATRYLDLLLLRVAQGVGLALEIPATMALLALASRKETRGGTMGFYTTMRMVGLGLGPLIGGFLHDRFGNDAAFLAGSGILLVAAVVVHFGVARQPSASERRPRIRDERGTNSRAPGGGLTAAVDGADGDHRGERDNSENGRNEPGAAHPGRSLFAAALATFVMAAAFTLVTTLENEFNSRLDIGAFAFSVAFSSLMISRLFFQVPMGRLSDRHGRKPFVVLGLVAMAASTAALGEVPSLGWFIAARFVQGIAAAAIVAPAIAYAGDITERGGGGREGRQMSTVTIGFGLGIAFGPLLAGALAPFFFELPFLATGALCLVAALAAWHWMVETVDTATAAR
jgi:MFS family permease